MTKRGHMRHDTRPVMLPSPPTLPLPLPSSPLSPLLLAADRRHQRALLRLRFCVRERLAEQPRASTRGGGTRPHVKPLCRRRRAVRPQDWDVGPGRRRPELRGRWRHSCCARGGCPRQRPPRLPRRAAPLRGKRHPRTLQQRAHEAAAPGAAVYRMLHAYVQGREREGGGRTWHWLKRRKSRSTCASPAQTQPAAPTPLLPPTPPHFPRPPPPRPLPRCRSCV